MFTVNRTVLAGISLAMVCCSISAQTNVPAVKEGPIYSLEQFGPVKSASEAEATYQKASKDIIAAGGGVIIIPSQAAPTWVPKNNSQIERRTPPAPEQTKGWGHGAGVTVVDARGNTPKILTPQTTGLTLERTLDLPFGESLGFWGYFPMLTMRNTVLRGSTSYRDWLQEAAPAGKDSKFYVSTIRGVFPGMFMSCGEYGVVERLCVKTLGYDKEKKMWYFTADTAAGQPKGTIMGNKNHVNVLDMWTDSHNENQTFDVRMWRHNYSQGDNYLFDARFKYMGDVHSTSGDENGVIYAAFVESMTGIFRGKVEKWDAANNELVYSACPTEGKTLGSGRPIINMNPEKWINKGTVMIVQPAAWIDDSTAMDNPVFQGKTYPTTIKKDKLGMGALKMGGLIHFSADAPVTDDAVGRYFSVDETDECVPRTDVRRWYLIDSVTKNADGTKDIKIIRHWWGAKVMDSPMLYKPENCSSDGHLKPLKYIIAPGANAYDVADGVNNPKRTIKLVTTSFTGTPADFAAGDPIEQAIGPDPFKPTPFRSWMWDQIPGAFPSSVFDIANNGAIMRDSLIWLHGNSSGDVEKDKASHYDRNPTWDKFLRLDSTCNTGIRFGADTANAAILFTQPYHEQPLKWNYDITTNHPPKVASLTVSRDTGVFKFTGPISTTGLSADATPARNLRGKNVAVKAGGTSAAITFPVEEADGDYAVFVEQSWLGNRAITQKDAKGFTIQFEKPAPADAKLDWMIVR